MKAILVLLSVATPFFGVLWWEWRTSKDRESFGGSVLGMILDILSTMIS